MIKHWRNYIAFGLACGIVWMIAPLPIAMGIDTILPDISSFLVAFLIAFVVCYLLGTDDLRQDMKDSSRFAIETFSEPVLK